MFPDRKDAGQQLATRLTSLLDGPAVVLALPRGGVPVAAEIARQHELPLDLILVRKIGLPGHEELAVAAIAGPDGADMVVNEDVADAAGLDRAAIDRLAEPVRAELRRRRALYLGDRAPVPLTGKTAIIVDDGIATGATMHAAIRSIRNQGAARIILAVPVASADVLDQFRAGVDQIVCLETPFPFRAVGAHYRSFPQVGDDAVKAGLAAFPPVPHT